MCRHNYAAGLLPKEAGSGMGLRTERVKQAPMAPRALEALCRAQESYGAKPDFRICQCARAQG